MSFGDGLTKIFYLVIGLKVSWRTSINRKHRLFVFLFADVKNQLLCDYVKILIETQIKTGIFTINCTAHLSRDQIFFVSYNK